MKKIKKISWQILVDLSKDNVGEYSAQCAYYIFLSFMPFLILLLSLIQYLNISQDTLYNILQSVLPTTMQGVIVGIIQEVSTKSVTTTIISVIVTLWAARKGFYALNKGLHYIFEVQDEKMLYLKFTANSILNTIEFLFFIIISLLLIVFGNTLSSGIHERFSDVAYVGIIINIIKNIIIALVLLLIFIYIYKVIPRHKVTVVSQLPGAIFSVVGWIAMSKVFSVYLDVFKNFASMYGSLTTVLLVLMWVYISMYIIFLGAEINKAIKENRKILSDK